MRQHEQLIQEVAKAEGWKVGGFRKFVRRLARFSASRQQRSQGSCEYHWCDDEVSETLQSFKRLPDAWRARIESWGGNRVLVLEVLEVEVTHNFLGGDAFQDYINLWWCFDASQSYHLRVFHAMTDGVSRCVLDGFEQVYRHDSGLVQDRAA